MYNTKKIEICSCKLTFGFEIITDELLLTCITVLVTFVYLNIDWNYLCGNVFFIFKYFDCVILSLAAYFVLLWS